MAKNSKILKEPEQKKERELFSVHSTKRKKSTVDKSTLRQAAVEYSDDEQVAQIKKLHKNKHKAKKLSVKNVKARGRVCYDTLVTGTVVGCCVERVFTERIVVSLPHKMKGYIPLTHVSSQYTKLMHQLASGCSSSEAAHTLPELYRVGQYLTAAVADTSVRVPGYTGLPLSLYPSDVNGTSVSLSVVVAGCVLQCSVTASEDHGYSLDVGVRGVKAAFLPEHSVPEGTSIGVGSVLPCVVTSVKGAASSAAILTVSAIVADVAAAASTPSERQYGLTVPGCAVIGVVAKSSPEGLTVHLGTEEDYYNSLDAGEQQQWDIGVVSPQHLRGPFDQCHLFRVGQKVQARVLFVTNFPRTIHLTLNKNVFDHKPAADYDPRHGLEIYSVVADAAVLGVTELGLSLRLSDTCHGTCFLSKVPGISKLSQLRRKYPPGTRVPSKLIAFNGIDHSFLVDITQVNTDEADNTAGLKVGMVLPVTILEHGDSGASVRTSNGIRGFVKTLHLTDTNMADPQLKLPVGKTVQAKIIEIKENNLPTGKKTSVYYTLKTLLVKSILPSVTDYAEDFVGIDTSGVVCSVQDRQLFVEFCGGARGILFSQDVPLAKTLNDAYQTGQVIQVRIRRLSDKPGLLYILSLPTKAEKLIKPKKLIDVNAGAKLSKIVEGNIRKNAWLAELKETLTNGNETNTEEALPTKRHKVTKTAAISKVSRIISKKKPQPKRLSIKGVSKKK